MRSIVIAFCLAWSPIIASAQNVSVDTDEIKWTVNSLHDTNDDSRTAYTCYFVSSGNSKITWVQVDYILEFTVTATLGSWKDLARDGALRYKVLLDDKPGEILFKKKGGVTTIEFSFIENGVNAMPYIFSVNDSRKNL